MKINCFIFCMCLMFTTYAQQQNGDAERMLQALKQSGIIRQEGNTLIYKVQKASDTAKVRLLYGNLFNNPNYDVRFEVAEQKQVKTNTNIKGVSSSNLPSVFTSPVNPNAISQASGSCCFCNLKTFQYVGAGSERNPASLFTEHTWTVPEGVTKIKLEGWSAGGNGWSNTYVSEVYGTDTIYNIKGGGGGGGAYVLSFVAVKSGDILKIRIPGGGSGSPLIVQFSETGVGTLNVGSGHNAKTNVGSNPFDGVSGRLEISSGLFSANTFSLRGESGQNSWLSNYVNKDNVTPGPAGSLMAPRIKLGDNYSVNGGDGGGAPKSLSGGSGLKILLPFGNTITAKDGGYPGGGGGSGFSELMISTNPLWKNGIGAAGLLIIYY